jgi:hypothetical protein
MGRSLSGVYDMKYRKEVTRMMVRNGAALMSRSGRNDDGRVGEDEMVTGSFRMKLERGVSWVEGSAECGRRT